MDGCIVIELKCSDLICASKTREKTGEEEYHLPVHHPAVVAVSKGGTHLLGDVGSIAL